MGLEQQLKDDMKIAMKAGDKVRLETIRGLRADLQTAQQKKIELKKGRELSEDEMVDVLNRAAKKRKEAIEQYKTLGRSDRADEETMELTIIEGYLPEQMDAVAIATIVTETIASVGAGSMTDIGKVMGAIMPRLKGKADGKVIQKIVREKLAAL